MDGGPGKQAKARQHSRSGAGGCTPQTTHQAGTLRQDQNSGTSCAKGTNGPRQLQGRAGTGQHKPPSVQVVPLPYPLQTGLLPLTYPLLVPLTLKAWEGLSVSGSR